MSVTAPQTAVAISWHNHASLREAGAEEQYIPIIKEMLRLVLLDLLRNAVLEMREYEVYQSQVRDVEQTETSRLFIFRPGTSIETEPLGALEKKIVSVVRNWEQNPLMPVSPLGPTVAHIVESIASGENISRYQAIREILIEEYENHKKSIALANTDITVKLVQSFFLQKKTSLRNLQSEIESSFQSSEKLLHKIQENAFSRLKFKHIRVALVVAILILFTLGRYFSGLQKVSSVGTFVTSSTSTQSDHIRNKLFDSTEEAQRFIEEWWNEPKRNLSAFLEFGKSSNVYVRRAVAKNLAVFKGHSQRVLPELRRLLRDSDILVRQYAIGSIAKLGSTAESAIPDLVFLVENDIPLQRHAADALTEIGLKDAAPVISAMEEILKRDSAQAKTIAKEVLKALHSDEAMRLLEAYEY